VVVILNGAAVGPFGQFQTPVSAIFMRTGRIRQTIERMLAVNPENRPPQTAGTGRWFPIWQFLNQQSSSRYPETHFVAIVGTNLRFRMFCLSVRKCVINFLIE
jgi:hypothetical protein